MLKIFKCKHCKNHFVIVSAKSTLIPIDCTPDSEYADDTYFERDKMKSHLMSCKGRRDDWQRVKYFYMMNPGSRSISEEKREKKKEMERQAERAKQFEKILSDEKQKGQQ